MKRLKLLLIALLFSAVAIAAQNFPADSVQSVKVDEFSAIYYSDMMARLDSAIVNLQTDPSSKMTIIGYRDVAIPIGKAIRTFKLNL